MKENCCEEKKHNENYCEMSGMMIKLANDAWAELMKEKMKKIFEEKNGSRMNKAAEATVEHTAALWKAKMDAHDMTVELSKEEIEAFKEKLMKAFME